MQHPDLRVEFPALNALIMAFIDAEMEINADCGIKEEPGMAYARTLIAQAWTEATTNKARARYEAAEEIRDSLLSVPTTAYAWQHKTPRQSYIDGMTDAAGIVAGSW